MIKKVDYYLKSSVCYFIFACSVPIICLTIATCCLLSVLVSLLCQVVGDFKRKGCQLSGGSGREGGRGVPGVPDMTSSHLINCFVLSIHFANNKNRLSTFGLQIELFPLLKNMRCSPQLTISISIKVYLKMSGNGVQCLVYKLKVFLLLTNTK